MKIQINISPAQLSPNKNINFLKELEDTFKTLPNPTNWDFVMLSYYNRSPLTRYDDNFSECTDWWGTHLYLVNLKNVRQKLDLFLRMTNQIDLQMRDLSNTKDLKILFTNKPIGCQAGFKTTVQR